MFNSVSGIGSHVYIQFSVGLNNYMLPHLVVSLIKILLFFEIFLTDIIINKDVVSVSLSTDSSVSPY